MKKIQLLLESDIKFFQDVLLGWFSENRREFPWRKKSATNYENQGRNSIKISSSIFQEIP